MYFSKFFIGIPAPLYFTFIVLSVMAEISYTLFFNNDTISGDNP